MHALESAEVTHQTILEHGEKYYIVNKKHLIPDIEEGFTICLYKCQLI
jgi:hypothetical protein